ncbi:MAG: aldehyde ferredoxin oxidoreductase, partial [Desulfobacteraceae bacterium]|nr:aldehyde ferredoxin oxidoreductase [Desulfobacteraceae bacterium]
MKFIRVNMKDKSIREETAAEAYQGMGGRGLTSAVINSEVPPKCDPLGPENKLVIAPGLLSGTPLVNTSRVSIGAKSPLTQGIKESNAGGTVGEALGRLGIAAIIIEDQAPSGELYTLKVDENCGVSLLDASKYKGSRTYAMVDDVFAEHGSQNAILCIGPAGEYRFKSASIQSSDLDQRPCRAAGRGGLGAVMGSKGVKAVMIARTKKQAAINDSEAFKTASREFAKAVAANPFSGELLPSQGTAALLAPLNNMGAFPSYNATRGVFDDWEKISGESLSRVMDERGGNHKHKGCSGCVIDCSNVYVDEKGGYITSSLEYETLWSLGGMIGVGDSDVIARLDRLCDEIGLDTMNTGVAIAVAMESGYKQFGDGEAAIEMVEEIGRGTDFGKILGNGPDAVGKHFNNPRVATVKGQSIAAYDPRGQQGTGVTYATSPMGADHTAGNVVGDYLAGKLDPLKPDGQVEASRNMQVIMAAVDCLGLCLFASMCMEDPEAAGRVLSALNAKQGT